ncbi:MAG: hypothetical protein PF572_01655 [Patescibacteria group bacterium]|jgi:hypothetical protein|nr:hypothetical protein [Patescibacteria group bacterium]
MQEDKWEQTVGHIKDTFEVLDEGSDHDDEEGGVDIKFIEFKGPLGKMRLEFILRPVILDKKTSYTRRIGSETNVQYVYSETEKNGRLDVYKLDEDSGEWEEIEATKMFE